MSETPRPPGLNSIWHGDRPSVRCHWRDCPGRAYRPAIVTLVPEGSIVARSAREVPLCDWHHEVVQRTGHLSLAYHPDDVAPEGFEFLPPAQQAAL